MNATRAGIALGSNLGDRLDSLKRARDQILGAEGVIPPVLQSWIYETVPIDCENGAPSFYNAVIEIGFEGTVDSLFEALRRIELALGRVRRYRHAPRSIDLDLLYFGELERDGPNLQLPHPRLASREFVLRPLADISPNLRLPNQTANVRELLRTLSGPPGAKRIVEQW